MAQLALLDSLQQGTHEPRNPSGGIGCLAVALDRLLLGCDVPRCFEGIPRARRRGEVSYYQPVGRVWVAHQTEIIARKGQDSTKRTTGQEELKAFAPACVPAFSLTSPETRPGSNP